MIRAIIERLIYEVRPEERLIAEKYTLADLIRDLREAEEDYDDEIAEWKE